MAAIFAVYEELRRAKRRPTQAQAAAELRVSEATLKRAQEDLGFPGWPPIEPRHS